MYRINFTGTHLYAKEIESVASAAEDIDCLIQGGEPVIIVEDLSDVRVLRIDPELVSVIE